MRPRERLSANLRAEVHQGLDDELDLVDAEPVAVHLLDDGVVELAGEHLRVLQLAAAALGEALEVAEDGCEPDDAHEDMDRRQAATDLPKAEGERGTAEAERGGVRRRVRRRVRRAKAGEGERWPSEAMAERGDGDTRARHSSATLERDRARASTTGLDSQPHAWAEHRTGRHCVDVAATCETTLPILQEMEDATKIMFRPPDEVHVSWTIHLIDLA